MTQNLNYRDMTLTWNAINVSRACQLKNSDKQKNLSTGKATLINDKLNWFSRSKIVLEFEWNMKKGQPQKKLNSMKLGDMKVYLQSGGRSVK